MPLEDVPQGGAHYAERQLLNVLRVNVPDPGIDDPNAADGTGHGPLRDADQIYTTTGDGTTSTYTLTPSVTGAHVVAVGEVYVGANKMKYGWDYLINWGDKFGSPEQKATTIQFLVVPTAAAAITVPFKYGKRVLSASGQIVAQGSFIAAGFSRNAQPLPKILVTLDTDNHERVGIGDNWDSTRNLGAVWHNMVWRIQVMSMYATECKDLTDSVVNAVMKGSHEDNYLMPIMNTDSITNYDYDFEQKAYMRVVRVSTKNRQIFGTP
jgi:hypothetical protein